MRQQGVPEADVAVLVGVARRGDEARRPHERKVARLLGVARGTLGRGRATSASLCPCPPRSSSTSTHKEGLGVGRGDAHLPQAQIAVPVRDSKLRKRKERGSQTQLLVNNRLSRAAPTAMRLSLWVVMISMQCDIKKQCHGMVTIMNHP